MNRFPSLLLLAATLTFALPVSAQPPGGGMGMGGPGPGPMRDMQGGAPQQGSRSQQMMDRMYERLGLTDSQRQKADVMHAKLRSKMQALQKERFELRRQLMELDPESKTYPAESKRLAKKTGELAEKMTLVYARHRIEFYGLLTAEQKEKLKAWQQQRREMWKQRMGNDDKAQ